MMWFWFSLIALLCWSGSDLFSKIGCRDGRDKYAHLKMVMAVGVVMGVHAAYEVFVGGVEINLAILWVYLPVSLLYIFSMALGYVGLRYIELSISSPVCNSSGALVALLSLITGGIGAINGWQLGAVVLVCAGVIGLGIVESREDEDLRRARQEASNYKYAKSWLALALPIAYCLLDAAGTFADNFVIEKISTMVASGEGEASANVAYELTFLLAGIVSFVYAVIIKKDRLVPKMEVPKYAGALFETAGQFAYIYAIADPEHLMLSAPMISSYCVLSVVWGRIFLKEKLSWKHYLMILLVVIGIATLGLFDA
jgi:drug/metabolite transporter (DMT)-like permease